MSFDAAQPSAPKDEVRLHLGGLSEGTRVLSSKGLVRVEKLRTGDRLVTRDLGMQTLRLVTERLVPQGEIVRIDPTAFEHAEAQKPLAVAPTQRILVRDWRAKAMFQKTRALVAARRLVDGELICIEAVGEHRMYSLHFDHLRIMYAGGFECGSATPVSRMLGG